VDKHAHKMKTEMTLRKVIKLGFESQQVGPNVLHALLRRNGTESRGFSEV
jgi:hypothetical protein